MSHNDPVSLREFYDSLWKTAEDAFAAENLKIDPHLGNKREDQRRGLTLILRPEAQAARAIQAGVEELKQLEPWQYYYAPEEYHVTILSLLTASTSYACTASQIESSAQAIASAIEGIRPFEIEFRGMTATPEAVMIQGFPGNDALARLRSGVLTNLKAAQIATHQRYPPRAAHLTVMRFRQPGQNLPLLSGKIESLRARFFGTTPVRSIYLVENDWYMSADKLNVIREYGLGNC